ncbi:MAG: M50 family metallopeptidase [Thermomicrobiales bacterium]|nr:M50 family metallopeptidase [Thermomicrobiales bacterium]
MPLGPFALISIFYLIVGARVVYELIRNFRGVFDTNFTREDRHLVDQAAFFVLLPIAVALHELGHAVAIWLFGGDVLGWGFFGFAGYVEFDPRQFTNAQQVIIASAGTLVNILLAALAVGLVFLKRPPMRAAINELLIQFTWISLLNALVLYPLLDFASGLNGDWMQMYDFSVPALSVAILVIHLSILGLLLFAWRSPKVRARIAQLTADTPAARRPGSRQMALSEATATERTLHEAASRVASGWPTPIEAAIQRGPASSALILTWGDAGLRRSVIASAPANGGIDLSGALRSGVRPPEQRPLGRDPAPLDAERLTLMLRLAMETVNGWTPSLNGPGAPLTNVPQ